MKGLTLFISVCTGLYLTQPNVTSGVALVILAGPPMTFLLAMLYMLTCDYLAYRKGRKLARQYLKQILGDDVQ